MYRPIVYIIMKCKNKWIWNMFKWTFYFYFHLLPLDKWDLCKTGTLNVHSWVIKVIVNRRFWINYIMMKKKKNSLNILNFVISGLTIWMSIPYLAIKVWIFTSAVVSIVVRNTIFRKALPSIVSGYNKQSINLNKGVATFEKHIFLSQTDLTRTGIISNSYNEMFEA